MDIDKAMTAANEIRRRATAMKDNFEVEKPGSRRNATATASALMRCRLAADSIETMCDDLVIQLWAYQQADARGRRMDKLVQRMQKVMTGKDKGWLKEPEEPEEFDDDDDDDGDEEDAWDDL